MTVENDTASIEATGTDTPENDTAAEWDYYDPDEDQDTGEAPAPEATDEGTEETAEPEPEDTAEAKPALVTLPDGTQAPLEEVTKGYLRQADYTRKSQELAQTRKAMDADLQRIEGITQAFIDHLSSMVPPKPDQALALRDPNAYVRADAQYNAAMAQVQKLIELGSQPKEIKAAADARGDREKRAAEEAILAERFPVIRNPEGRQKFFTAAVEAAQSVGFSIDELKGVTDHRIFAALHWANEGLKAAKARETAKAKVANVPPASPRKPGQPVQQAKNADAMRKLARSGSIRDALNVDWD